MGPSDEPPPSEEPAEAVNVTAEHKAKRSKAPNSVSFEASGIGPDEGTLIVGDEVELTLVVNKRTGQQQATKIELIAPNPNRERGIVCAIRDRGEAQIRCAERA